MIGQESIIRKIEKIKDNLPRFIVITGNKGQGKKTLAKEISKISGYNIIDINTKVDDIRNMIDMSYKQVEPLIYLIADADDMSLNAQNSLLKVIEEPPQNAYFIMTLKQIENTLGTIKSRCFEIKLQNYDWVEKEEMIEKIAPNIDIEERSILKRLDNYWQMQTIFNYGIKDFYDFVSNVYNNIYKVQGANSFKFSNQLDVDNNGSGYDIELFFIMFILLCMEQLTTYVVNEEFDYTNDDVFNICIAITYESIKALSIKGINRKMLIDMWVIDIRKAFSERGI